MSLGLHIPVVTPLATAAGGSGGDILVRMQQFVLELAVILVAARAGGLLLQRVFRLPSVIGELLSGVAIGPFALGAVPLPVFGPLFPRAVGGMPVSPEIYALAVLASLLLLFLSGLETDLGVFLRYFTAGSAVGMGGVVVSFLVGVLFARLAGLASAWMAPQALFLGAVSTATSVGITARILAERRQTDSPEGVTILAAAVLDDVLGIIVLALVMAIVRAGGTAGLAWGRLGVLIAKTFTVWLVCTAFGLLTARRLSAAMKRIGPPEVITAFAFGLALVLAGLMEAAGLAMIIGAYIMGLSLSRTDLAMEIRRHLHGTYELLVPVFFCVMGMLIDLHALHGMWKAGLVFSALALAAKLIGGGLPALGFHFNLRGALRIGLGMVPRGEVALIIAGAGVASGAAQPEIFGLAVLMTILTTLLAPPLLVRAFEGGPGVTLVAREQEKRCEITLDIAHPDLAEFLYFRLMSAFRREAFFVTPLGDETLVCQIRKDDMIFTLRLENSRLVFSAPARYADIGRFVLLEEVLDFQSVAESLKNAPMESLSGSLAGSLFDKG